MHRSVDSVGLVNLIGSLAPANQCYNKILSEEAEGKITSLYLLSGAGDHRKCYDLSGIDRFCAGEINAMWV